MTETDQERSAIFCFPSPTPSRLKKKEESSHIIGDDNKKMWNYTNELIDKMPNRTVDETILKHLRAENIKNIVEKFEEAFEEQVKKIVNQHINCTLQKLFRCLK